MFRSEDHRAKSRLLCRPRPLPGIEVGGAEAREEMGVTEGMLRINVGLEDPEDLIEDLDHALARAGL